MSERLAVVTIDGPSGVGKSTISRRVAGELGFTYLDTGAMYRAVAYGCMQRGIDPGDEALVAPLLDRIRIELLPALSEGDDTRVVLDGEEISNMIRTQEVGMAASAVSALGVVRERLTRLQRRMGAAGKIVAEGRDTGTVVFPDAAWKFYLDATPEERARRRIGQLRGSGAAVDEEQVLAQIIKRDRDDSERTIAPLRAAPDAVVIDSTRLGPDEVVQRILARIRESYES